MRKLTVFAPAKLNLYLDVLDKRPDGYHNIKTLFEKIGLTDEITIREKGKGLDIKVEPQGRCPSGKDNIVHAALEALFKEAGVNLGLEIIIKKNIPVSSGLGGGSSDAASVLRSINEAFELDVSLDRLFSIAASIGKDVPFFMLDAAFAIGQGTGESLEAVGTDFTLSHVVIKPAISISTAEMYKRVNSHPKRPDRHDIEKIVSGIKDQDIASIYKGYYNIFEETLGDYAPYINKAKTLLLESGVAYSCLSGSGPSVFCTFKDREGAMEALKRIPRNKDIEVFLATTYKGGIYGDNRSQDISQGRFK